MSVSDEELVKRELDRLVKEVKTYKLNDFLDMFDTALSINVNLGLLHNDILIESVTFQVTYGGPNEYVTVADDYVEVSVYWGSKSASKKIYGDYRSVLDELEGIIKEHLRSILCG